MNENVLQRSSLKQALYKVSVSISIFISILWYGTITIIQLNSFEAIPAHLFKSNLLSSAIIATVIFLICTSQIIIFNLGSANAKIQRKRFGFIFLLSVFFCVTGVFTLSLFDASNWLSRQIIHIYTSRFVIGTLILFGTLLFINAMTSSILRNITERAKREQLEYENALLKAKNIETTYLQLRQQVNPHFLFNALNTLKTLIKRQPDKAEMYLVKLSGFLRKSIQTDIEPIITINEELVFCSDYVELQKTRFGEAIHLTINIPENMQQGCVPVFSIQQLLENAIKHNALTIEAPLKVQIRYENQWIIVSNNTQKKMAVGKTTGSGLANLSERYRLLSGDEVIIKSDEHHFSVSIKVLNNEDYNHRR